MSKRLRHTQLSVVLWPLMHSSVLLAHGMHSVCVRRACLAGCAGAPSASQQLHLLLGSRLSPCWGVYYGVAMLILHPLQAQALLDQRIKEDVTQIKKTFYCQVRV